MKIKKIYALYFLLGIFFVYAADAKNLDGLMTVSDIKNNASSNITLTNNTDQTITVSALFIPSFDTNNCSSCNGSVAGGDNAGGAFVAPVTFAPHQKIAIGQNFLYNMLYNAMYYLSTITTAPCALPGCTWPGDNTDVTGWCITINAASLDSDYTQSTYTRASYPAAAAPAYGAAGNFSPFGYKYSLINPATLGGGAQCLGPITCNDQTLTCSVSSAQNESFSSYS